MSANNGIILSGVKTAWMYSIVPGSPDTFALKYSFGNLLSANLKLLLSAASANTEKIEIASADNGITQFPKESYIISGIDDSEIASETGGINASGLGEITLVLNEAPEEATSFTAFTQELEADKDDTVLIIIPTGYTFDRTGTGTSKKPDGFAYMFGKRSNDIDLAYANANQTISLTFASQKQSDLNLTSKAFTGEGILVKRGGAGKDIPATVNIPIDLVSGDITNLKLGKVVLKETPAV